MALTVSLLSSNRSTTGSSTASDIPWDPYTISSVNETPPPGTAPSRGLAFDASCSLASSNRNASQSSLAYDSHTSSPNPRNMTRVIRKPIPGAARRKVVSFAPDTIARRSSSDLTGMNWTEKRTPLRRTKVATWVMDRRRHLKGLYRYRRRPPTAYTSEETKHGPGSHLRAGTMRKKQMECYEGT